MKRERLFHYDFFPRYKPGNFTKVARSFDEEMPHDKVFLIERVSGCERKRNLKDQDANLRSAIKPVGAKVVGRFAIQVSGTDPFWLWKAAQQAKRVGATVLLAETTDRFIRHPSFHSVLRPNYQATDEQLKELVEATQGMRLITHLDPDASPSEVRSYQRKRGQRFKRNKGGRPKNRTAGYMTRRWEDLHRKVEWLAKHDWSVRRIAAKVKVPKSTVDEWIRKAK
jgi:hypothetical protein